MGKTGQLTARERRLFEDLVRTYYEFEAENPGASLDPSSRGTPATSTAQRIWLWWRHRRR